MCSSDLADTVRAEIAQRLPELGTGIVEIYPGTTGSDPFPLFGFHGNCYSQATNGLTGYEPWVTDGTVAGTFLLKDIYVGTSGSFPARFATAGDRLFFYASDGITAGGELWVTDGTSAGTRLVKDIYPGASSGFTGSFPYAVGIGRRVLFVANDGLTGSEFYISDGTTAGTAQLGDLWTGITSGAVIASGFVLANGYGFVVGNNGSTGNELYAFTASQLGAAEAEYFGVACTSTGTPAIGLWGGVPALGNAEFKIALYAAPANRACTLLMNDSRSDTRISGCTIYPTLVPTLTLASSTDSTGNTCPILPVPARAELVGLQIYAQWILSEPAGPIFGVAGTSNAVRIRIGGS